MLRSNTYYYYGETALGRVLEPERREKRTHSEEGGATENDTHASKSADSSSRSSVSVPAPGSSDEGDPLERQEATSTNSKLVPLLAMDILPLLRVLTPQTLFRQIVQRLSHSCNELWQPKHWQVLYSQLSAYDLIATSS